LFVGNLDHSGPDGMVWYWQLEIAIWPPKLTFFELVKVENPRFAIGISMLSITVRISDFIIPMFHCKVLCCHCFV